MSSHTHTHTSTVKQKHTLYLHFVDWNSLLSVQRSISLSFSLTQKMTGSVKGREVASRFVYVFWNVAASLFLNYELYRENIKKSSDGFSDGQRHECEWMCLLKTREGRRHHAPRVMPVPVWTSTCAWARACVCVRDLMVQPWQEQHLLNFFSSWFLPSSSASRNFSHFTKVGHTNSFRSTLVHSVCVCVCVCIV